MNDQSTDEPTEATVEETSTETGAERTDEAGDEATAESAGGTDVERLENEGDIAADYLEELLDIADLDGDLDMDVEGDRASVSIVGGDLAQLVGRTEESFHWPNDVGAHSQQQNHGHVDHDQEDKPQCQNQPLEARAQVLHRRLIRELHVA